MRPPSPSPSVDRTGSPSEDLRGGGDVGELVVQARRRGAGDLVGRQHRAVGVPPVKGEGRVDREQHVVAEVGADADRRLATVVGRDAAHDDAGCLLTEQPRVQVRAPVKRGVDVLGHEQVGLGLAEVVAQLVARGARGQHGARQLRVVLGAVVADVDERPVVAGPVVDEGRDVVVAGGVVACAPGRVVEALLRVDDDQDPAGVRIITHGRTVALRITDPHPRRSRTEVPFWRADPGSTCGRGSERRRSP